MSHTEASLDKLIARPNDLIRLRFAINNAKRALAIRRKYQGNSWWQTEDAVRRLEILQTILPLGSDYRGRLVEADILATEVDQLSSAQKHRDPDKAVSKAMAAANLYRMVLGDQGSGYASYLNLVAELYHDLQRHENAQDFYVQALSLRHRTLGEQHPDYALSLSNLGELYSDMGRYQEAEISYMKSLTAYEGSEGCDTFDYAIVLNNVAVLYLALARYGDAERFSRKAVSIDAKHIGTSDPDYAVALKTLAEIRSTKGQYHESEQLYRQILAIDRKATGTNSSHYAVDLNNLAILYKDTGRLKEARPLLEKAVKIVERTVGTRDRLYTSDTCNLANVYELEGKFSDAEGLLRRALTIDKEILGSSHPDYADDLNDLAGLYENLGRYNEALPLYLEATDITRTALGQDHLDYALRLSNLAGLYQVMGSYAKAEQLLQKALTIDKNVLGDHHPSYATTLDNLASLYDDMARSDEALPLREKVLAIRAASLGRNHPDYAITLNNLASAYREFSRFNEADRLLGEALRINRRVYGNNSEFVAVNLNNLALLYAEEKQYAKAITVGSQSLSISQQVFGTSSTHDVPALNNLAESYAATGNLKDAERLQRRATEILKPATSPQSPEYANRLTNLSLVLAAQGKWQEATQYLLEASSIKWNHVTTNLGPLSPEQQQRWLKQDTFREGELLWTCAFADHATALQALQAVLWRKHLGIEAARQQSAALRASLAAGSPSWRSDWFALSKLRREYAEIALRLLQDGQRTQRPSKNATTAQYLHNLGDRIDETEKRLRQTNDSYEHLSQLQNVDVEDLRKLIRTGEALVEYVRYRPIDFRTRTYGPEHYGAIVLRGKDGQATAIDLGKAMEIDEIIDSYRDEVTHVVDRLLTASEGNEKAILQKSETILGDLSLSLRSHIWTPLEETIEGSTRVYIAPDGELSLFPFECLAKPAANGQLHYLAEDLQFSYLGTGRDLIDLTANERPNSDAKTAVLIGNPNFHATLEEVRRAILKISEHSSQSAQRSNTMLERGAGTLSLNTASKDWSEVPALGRMLHHTKKILEDHNWSVTLFEWDDAVAEALMAVHSPAILQLATHGTTNLRSSSSPIESGNPLLKSTLVFAGADTANLVEVSLRGPSSTDPDLQGEARSPFIGQEGTDRTTTRSAILTAYELSGTDLNGTDLVNLTACDTGIGEVTPDGVVGLRQAFHLAGARSLIVSLWQIPSEETTTQVSNFYDLWLRGNNRLQAFHLSQLSALEASRQAHKSGHPIYWAGTIYLGDPGDLSSKKVN